MKLYKITGKLNETATTSVWAGSQDAAGKARKALMSEHDLSRSEITTDEVEVPTNKAGLIDFLNAL